MTTGQIIKQARTAAGMTQAQLAEKLGAPYQSISQWERDARNPRYETLVKISDALGANVEDLFCDPLKGLDTSSDFPRLEATKEALDNWLDAIDSELKSAKATGGNECRHTPEELEFMRDTINQLLHDREYLRHLTQMEEKRKEQVERLVPALNLLSPSAVAKVSDYIFSLLKVPEYQYKSPIKQAERKVIPVESYELLIFQYEQAMNQFEKIRVLPYDRETRAHIMVYQKDTWPDIIQRLMDGVVKDFLIYESDEEEEKAKERKSYDPDKEPCQGPLDKYLGLGPADFQDYEG